MGKSTPGRCGYNWTGDYSRARADRDINLPSCCVRETVTADSDRCIWHVKPDEVDEKTVEALTEARASEAVRKQNTPIDEILDGAILSECKLAGFSLSGIAIRDANLTGADLQKTDFTGASLWRADMVDTDLRDADLTDADLRGADLTDSILHSVNLTNAYLWGANLTNVNLENANLINADLRNADLVNVKFCNANLTDANLWNTDLTDADFSDSSLANADLRGADLTEANLWGADLTNADLTGADLTDTDLRYADLTDSSLPNADLSGAQLSNTTLIGAEIPYSNMTNASLSNADLTDAFLWDIDLTAADLFKADLTNASLRNANLADTFLADADLTKAELRLTDLTDADLRNADLTDADLLDADLTGADLRDTNLTDTNLTGVDLTGRLERANFTRANFFDADLRGTEFYGAITTDTQINEGTEFGDHYTDDGEIKKAAWALSQIEELSRQNALPDQVREAFTKRKDRRRNHYWHHSKIPGWLRMYVCRLKTRVNSFFGHLKGTFKRWANAADPPVILFINWFRARLHGTDPETYSNTTDDEAADQPVQTSDDTETAAEAEASDAEATEPESETAPASTDGGIESETTNWERYVNTAKWGWLALSGAIMRYGESARRVVTLSLLTILSFGMAYPFVGGIEDGGTVYTIQFTSEQSLAGLATAGEALLRNLYFSTITFTTIGYANVAPVGPWSRLLVGIESFAGALLMALLVFVLGRQSTR